jgi:acetylornithine deacetylase
MMRDETKTGGIAADLKTEVENSLPEALAFLEELVGISSYSTDADGVNRAADLYAEKFKELGFIEERVQANDPQVSHLRELHKAVTGNETSCRYSRATSDARFYHLYAGVPCVCYGPSATRIHGEDECVNLDSFKTVLSVMIALRINPAPEKKETHETTI